MYSGEVGGSQTGDWVYRRGSKIAVKYDSLGGHVIVWSPPTVHFEVPRILRVGKLSGLRVEGRGREQGGVVMLIEQTRLLQVGIILLDLGLVGGILEPRCPAEQRNA